MEPINLQMKLVRVNHFGFDTSAGRNEGVSFRFQEWEFRHDATLMLKSNGETVDDARRSPLYRIQNLEPGEMVECEFTPYQDRRQEQRDGQRDSVKDVIGLRLSAVRPLSDSRPSASNGAAAASGARTSS